MPALTTQFLSSLVMRAKLNNLAEVLQIWIHMAMLLYADMIPLVGLVQCGTSTKM